ncbi:MAG: hypothetical protein EOP62_23640 [Sphingomonadales bacterium]|nr:MAG: hypothetical protein EOP62_23640 [Sphingomonadales bacterium]
MNGSAGDGRLLGNNGCQVAGIKEEFAMNTRKKSPAFFALSMALALTVGGAAMAPAPAQAFVCANCASEWTQIMNQMQLLAQKIQDAGEYTETAMRWKRQLEHFQQQLVKLKHAMMGFSMPKGMAMQKVLDDYMVVERCGGGFSLASVVQGFSLNPNGNIVEQRKTICASIQIAQNRKYNETIAFVTETLPQLEAALKQTNERRDSSEDQGVTQASQYDAANYSNAFDTRYRAWEVNIRTYDTYIEAMEYKQRALTHMGLKGEENPLGAVVKTAALKAALEVGD